MRAVTAVLFLTTLATSAYASFDLPEPGSVSLVVVGVAAALWFGRKRK